MNNELTRLRIVRICLWAARFLALVMLVMLLAWFVLDARPTELETGL